MIKNPFHKEPEAQPPAPDPTKALQNEIDKLESDSFRLRSLIMATQHKPTKDKLMTKRAKIIEKITNLKAQQHKPQEEQASHKINNLFRENLYIVEVRGKRIKPDENLTIPLTFSCGHKQERHVKELLRFQREPISEQTLLSKLEGIFNAKATLEAKFYCPECKKAKDKERAEHHRYDDLSIGTCTVQLKIV